MTEYITKILNCVIYTLLTIIYILITSVCVLCLCWGVTFNIFYFWDDFHRYRCYALVTIVTGMLSYVLIFYKRCITMINDKFDVCYSEGVNDSGVNDSGVNESRRYGKRNLTLWM